MASRRQTLSFTTASIGASASLDINRNVGPNWITILKIKVTPNTLSTSPLRVELYSRNTFLSADRVGGYTLSKAGPVLDPMEDTGSGAVDKDQVGFVTPYDDLDNTGQIHLRIYNDHTVGQTYDIAITWEPRFFISAGSTISMSPGYGHDITKIDVADNTSTQKVEVALTGVQVGSARKRIDFRASDATIILSAADTGSVLQLFSKSGAALTKTRRLNAISEQWTSISPGLPFDYTQDGKATISMPNSADSELELIFRVPDDLVTTSDALLTLEYAMTLSPGVTNNKVSLKIKYKLDSGSFSSYTSTDTITLANNTAWAEFIGTNLKIASGTLTAGQLVSLRLYRDTTVANNAATEFNVHDSQLKYTSIQ